METRQSTFSFNFADLFSIVCDAVPERLAIICGDERLSYAELNLNADKVAVYLQANGIQKGDTLGLQMANCPAYLVGFFAACKLGAIPFNINYRYLGAELEYLYKNSTVAALIYDAELSESVNDAIKTLDAVPVMISLDEDSGNAKAADYQFLLSEMKAKIAEVAHDDNDLLIIYTGGTTGMPKGVIWPHKSLFYGALGGGGWYHPAGPVECPEDLTSRALEGPRLNVFPVAPLIHGAALWTSLGSLMAGHTLILNDEKAFRAEQVWKLAQQYDVDIMAIVGDATALPLAEALEKEPDRWQLPNLQHIGSGGAILSKTIQARLEAALPQILTTSSLGTTETGTLGPGTKKTDDGIMRYGRREDLVVILDGRPAVPGETGIVARRGYLPVGYYGDEKKTKEVFFNLEGVDYALSGDAARLEEDGSITVLGRGTSCINTGGEKVYPEEVEQVLKSHPAISDALVVGIPHPRWTQQVAAVVVLKVGAQCDFESLKAHCAAFLSGYKIPKKVTFAAEVQRNLIGKPDYAWARQQLLEDQV